MVKIGCDLFIFPIISPITILSDREQTVKVWRRLADHHPWPLPCPYWQWQLLRPCPHVFFFCLKKEISFYIFPKNSGPHVPFSDRLHPSTRIRFLFENENFYLCTRIGPELFYNSLSVSLISMFGRQSCLPKHFYVLVKLRTSRSCKWNSAGSFNASTFQPCVAFWITFNKLEHFT